MFVVHKYPLNQKSQKIGLPVGAEILSFGEQNGGLVMWVQVPRDMPTSMAVLERTIFVLMPGDECPYKIGDCVYHGTITVNVASSGIVYHLFEWLGYDWHGRDRGLTMAAQD
jgi:hypothetical protein